MLYASILGTAAYVAVGCFVGIVVIIGIMLTIMMYRRKSKGGDETTNAGNFIRSLTYLVN